MEATVTPQPDDERLRAPAHVVDLLTNIMRPPAATLAGPAPGSVAAVRLARQEAQMYADRIWQEAFLAGWRDGGTWGLTRTTKPIRVEVRTADEREAMLRRFR